MLQETLSVLFQKDLNRVKEEINAYSNETDIWILRDGISNTAGNLCLHLVGNVKHFVGKIIGNIPYERQREQEFTDKDIPKTKLLENLDETIASVTAALAAFKADELNSIYPVKVFGAELTTEHFLLHLYGHLNYHLGQINYHRRLLNK